ncbi:MAG: hypothetical protein AAGU74_05635 [Bacillota bacterium]
MGGSKPNRSGWIYVGAAVALCLIALVVWRVTERNADPDRFTISLKDLMDETLDETSDDAKSSDGGPELLTLDAFLVGLNDAGIWGIELERGETTAIYKFLSGDFSKDDRFVCSLDGAGKVTAVTLELIICKNPGPLDDDPIAQIWREQDYKAFCKRLHTALNACMETLGTNAAFSYAARDRMDAAVEAALLDRKAFSREEDAFTLSASFREQDDYQTIHLSIEVETAKR